MERSIVFQRMFDKIQLDNNSYNQSKFANLIGSMQDSSSEYVSLVGDYTKFMLLRVAIFATIVISIFSGTSQLRDFPSKKINTIKSLRNTTFLNVSGSNQDELIELMFFYQQNEGLKKSEASSDDTLLVNQMISDKFPGLSLESFRSYDTAVKIKSYLQGALDSIYFELKTISDKAFIIKLSILPDLSFDLRYWVFILPILFSVTAIYSYILQFRIELQQLSDNKSNDGTKNLNPRQYPYLYLKGLFNIISISLGLLFLSSIYDIAINFNDLLISYLITFYFLTFYFSMIYIGTLYKKIFTDYLPDKNLLINNLWNWSVKRIKQFFRLTRCNNVFRTGAIFLILTLFVSMTFQTCTTGNEKPITIKGYKLIIDYKTSIWQYDDQTLGVGRFYQINYISLFVAALLLSIFLFKKKKSRIKLWYLKFLTIYFTSIFILFSMYFSFYFIFYPATFIFLQSALLLALWIRKNYFTSFNKPEWNYTRLAETLIVYCLPFSLFSVYWLYHNIGVVSGWAFLYLSILFLMTSCYLFTSEKG